MCNLYTIRTPLIDGALFKAVQWVWQPSDGLHSIRPTDSAPIIVVTDDGLTGIEATWGFPAPPQYGPGPVYNTRNLGSAFWRPWIGQRALAPVTAFCEHDARKRKHWFGTGATIVFAGIWGKLPGEPLPRFSILTTESAEPVAAVHPKAMPVLLETDERAAAWIRAGDFEAGRTAEGLAPITAPPPPQNRQPDLFS